MSSCDFVYFLFKLRVYSGAFNAKIISATYVTVFFHVGMGIENLGRPTFFTGRKLIWN